jgi:hypothetical protein
VTGLAWLGVAAVGFSAVVCCVPAMVRGWLDRMDDALDLWIDDALAPDPTPARDPQWVMFESQHLFDTTARVIAQSAEVAREQQRRIDMRLDTIGGIPEHELRNLLDGNWETDR